MCNVTLMYKGHGETGRMCKGNSRYKERQTYNALLMCREPGATGRLMCKGSSKCRCKGRPMCREIIISANGETPNVRRMHNVVTITGKETIINASGVTTTVRKRYSEVTIT